MTCSAADSLTAGVRASTWSMGQMRWAGTYISTSLAPTGERSNDEHFVGGSEGCFKPQVDKSRVPVENVTVFFIARDASAGTPI